jgi:hypothetical protein
MLKAVPKITNQAPNSTCLASKQPPSFAPPMSNTGLNSHSAFWLKNGWQMRKRMDVSSFGGQQIYTSFLSPVGSQILYQLASRDCFL